MEAQYGKFLDMIRVVRINVPLVDVLAGMSNYGKFLKELVSNKHKRHEESYNNDAKEPAGFDKTKSGLLQLATKQTLRIECITARELKNTGREKKGEGAACMELSGKTEGADWTEWRILKALCTIDGEGEDWKNHSEDEDYALHGLQQL
ncbi:hypothetical protein Tco_0859900 [Tanacetum coccineum]|uniref:Uncharacterized protein n=1 Tax=Tanacetum coccineum TaxID=301880 RepID=A0ABQ5BH72_9ASTR